MVHSRLAHDTLYVGVDVGKRAHVAGFLSATLLSRHQRFEHCPALAFDNSREGFRSLVERIQTYVPLTQVQALLEVTGHYHRALLQYLQELAIPVYIIHVQKRQEGLLKTAKRDALGLANLLYNQLEKGIQVGDPVYKRSNRDGLCYHHLKRCEKILMCSWHTMLSLLSADSPYLTIRKAN